MKMKKTGTQKNLKMKKGEKMENKWKYLFGNETD